MDFNSPISLALHLIAFDLEMRVTFPVDSASSANWSADFNSASMFAFILFFTPDIVKLNTCMLFYDYFHHDKFPNLPVSLVSELHNYSTCSASSNQVAIPSFRTNLRRFCPSIIGSFFWNNIPQSIRDKPSKRTFRKALLRWYLLQY